MSHSIPAFNMIFVLRAMPIIMVLAAQIYADRVMINLAIIHAHQPEALYASQDGKETIVQKVNYMVLFFAFDALILSNKVIELQSFTML